MLVNRLKKKKAVNDDSIVTHTYCHVLSVLLTGQKKKKKNEALMNVFEDVMLIRGVCPSVDHVSGCIPKRSLCMKKILDLRTITE